MEHHDRGLAVGICRLDDVGKGLGQEQPRRKANDTAQLACAGEAGKERHSTTLREATKNDALRGDSRVDLFLDEIVEVLLAALDTLCVLVTDERVDVSTKLFLYNVRYDSNQSLKRTLTISNHPGILIPMFCPC
jgi:hypothetical protein